MTNATDHETIRANIKLADAWRNNADDGKTAPALTWLREFSSDPQTRDEFIAAHTARILGLMADLKMDAEDGNFDMAKFEKQAQKEAAKIAALLIAPDFNLRG